MKKQIILIIMILFLTGCNCIYNLKIDGNIYSEEITIVGENNNEINNFNKNWQIPTDKDEYYVGTDPSSDNTFISKKYQYNLSNNKITFKNDYTMNKYINSTAISKCYSKLTVSNYRDSTIISTSSKATCFENNPGLNNVIINITVDRPVKKSNADTKTGNTYIWNLNKDNANNKSVNLVLDNTISQTNDKNNNNSNNNNSNSIKNSNNNINNNNINNMNEITNNEQKDYTMYIFSAVLLFALLTGYIIVNRIKNKEDRM